MPRHVKTYQFDLSVNSNGVEKAQTPLWQVLPVGTRQVLTHLIARLVLDHSNYRRAADKEGMQRDV